MQGRKISGSQFLSPICQNVHFEGLVPGHFCCSGFFFDGRTHPPGGGGAGALGVGRQTNAFLFLHFNKYFSRTLFDFLGIQIFSFYS